MLAAGDRLQEAYEVSSSTNTFQKFAVEFVPRIAFAKATVLSSRLATVL